MHSRAAAAEARHDRVAVHCGGILQLKAFLGLFGGIFCLFPQSTFSRIFLGFSREIFRELFLHQVCED